MVRHLFSIVFTVAIMSLGLPFLAVAQSCKCEPIECNACEQLEGTTFYTEKCEGGRTKSCQRPTCVPLEDPPPECKKVEKAEATGTLVAQAQPNEKPALPESGTKKQVGLFTLVRGVVLVESPYGDRKAANGAPVYEKDVVVTDDTSQAKIMFSDKNVVNIAQNSRVKMRGFELDGAKGYTSSTIDLVYGKLRSQVVTKPKYADKPTFKVRTPSAVAGVRGTDFITTHIKGGDVTKVETLKGAVELGGHGRDEKIVLNKGQYGSYVVLASNSPGVFTDDDIGSFIHKGFLTPVYQLTESQYEKLNIETDYRPDGSDRIVAEAKAEPICRHPKGDLNQCSWVCENNPAGEKNCRTDIAGVRCVRARCNANGKWSQSERLPASSGSVQCAGDRPVVGPCDF